MLGGSHRCLRGVILNCAGKSSRLQKHLCLHNVGARISSRLAHLDFFEKLKNLKNCPLVATLVDRLYFTAKTIGWRLPNEGRFAVKAAAQHTQKSMKYERKNVENKFLCTKPCLLYSFKVLKYTSCSSNVTICACLCVRAERPTYEQETVLSYNAWGPFVTSTLGANFDPPGANYVPYGGEILSSPLHSSNQ
jgi:hypothetical protein